MSDKKKKRFLDKLERIEEAQREFEKERKKAVIHCAHQNEKGKLKIRPINEKGDYECKYCRVVFNMNTISQADIKDACETLHNAIQQIRAFSDAEDDEKLVRLLGELDFNLQETGELYDRIVNMYGKNKNKNKKNKNFRDKDDFGSYGVGAISFIGGGGNKGKK
jgi:hypothetical protein